MRVPALILVLTAVCSAAGPDAFPPITPEAAASAQERVETVRRAAIQIIKSTLDRGETRHFVVCSDWPAEQRERLGRYLERTYDQVARQFDADQDKTVFPSKILVIALSKRETFVTLAAELDEAYPPEGSLGYLRAHAEGSAHLLLFRPPAEVDEARWAGMLVRELSLGFLDRYRGAGTMPVWMNRGIAALVQRQVVPADRTDPSLVKTLASGDFDLTILFDPDVTPSPAYDAAATTLVSMLVELDREGFVEVMSQVKAGIDAQHAIQESFGLNPEQLENEWKRYAQSRP